MSRLISRIEARLQGKVHYFTGKPCTYGHVSYRFVSDCSCLECYKDVDYIENKRIYDAYRYKKFEMRIKTRVKKYYSNNITTCKLKNLIYKKTHKDIVNADCAKRRATKLNAKPSWVSTMELKQIYKNCPSGLVVDHIIPLINDKVCGLHIPCNLQYLTKKENSSKGNKLLDKYALGSVI